MVGLATILICDDESDLRALLRHDLTGTRTGAFLASAGIAHKLSSTKHGSQHESARTASQT